MPILRFSLKEQYQALVYMISPSKSVLLKRLSRKEVASEAGSSVNEVFSSALTGAASDVPVLPTKERFSVGTNK